MKVEQIPITEQDIQLTKAIEDILPESFKHAGTVKYRCSSGGNSKQNIPKTLVKGTNYPKQRTLTSIVLGLEPTEDKQKLLKQWAKSFGIKGFGFVHGAGCIFIVNGCIPFIKFWPDKMKLCFEENNQRTFITCKEESTLVALIKGDIAWRKKC